MNLKLFDKLRSKKFHRTIFNNIFKISKNIEKNSGWKNIIQCPICKSKKKKIWEIKNNIPIFICQNCLTGYSGKSAVNMHDVYDSQNQLKQHKIAYESPKNIRKKIMGKERVKLLQKFKKKGKLLDYGCGNAWFLQTAKRYYECYGYEPSLNYDEEISKKNSIKIFKQINNLSKYKFDIITLFDVIEHVEQPKDILNWCHQRLNKNGIMLIYTPNFQSLGFYLMRENQNLAIPPLHLTYFHHKTIKRLIGNKFKILYQKTFGFDLADYFSYLREYKKLKINFAIKKEIQEKQKMIDSQNLGNHLRIVLKKLF